MRINIARFMVLCCLAAANLPAPTAAQTEITATPQRETFTGTLIGIGGPFGGRSTSFTFTLSGTTPDADLQRYVGVLAERGQDGLMSAIRSQKLGTFALTGQVGRDVNVVRVRRTETGRRITLLFERWLNLFEVRYGTRSQDYPFTYAEIFVDAQGKGEGTLISAARIRFDKDDQMVEIENFGIYPARLAGIQKR